MEENNEFINKNEDLSNNMTKHENKNKYFSCLENIQPKQKENKVKFICKKREYFKVENIDKLKRELSKSENKNEGRWSKEEHNKFLEGISKYGTNWKKFKILIKTRSTLQIRSHAQKFYFKMKSCKDNFLGIDFTLNSIHNIKDMISQIKSININYDILNVFNYLNNKIDTNKNENKFKKKVNKDTINYSNNKLKEDIEKNYINIHKNLNMEQNNKFSIFENYPKQINLNQQINNNIVKNFNNIFFIGFNNNFPLNNNLLQLSNNNNRIINNQNYNLVLNSFNNIPLNINNNQNFLNKNIISINIPFINRYSNLEDLRFNSFTKESKNN